MAVSIREQAGWLVAIICWEKRWATPEETEAWLKTETGQHIAALMQNDSTESLLPDKTGGGETVGMKSAFYVDGSAGVRCPWRFGDLHYGGVAGAACAAGSLSPAYSGWAGVPRLKGSGKKRGEWAGF